jgi:hypothetical protein
MAIPVIALVAAGLSAAGTGFSIAGSLKPYIDKATPLINNNEWGDWRTAGSVSGVGAGINPDLSYHRYQVENKKATTLRTIGGALTGLGGIMGSFGGSSGGSGSSIGGGSGIVSAANTGGNAAGNAITNVLSKKAKDGLLIKEKDDDELIIQSIKPIRGPSHKKGGVKLKVNEKPIEAEGGEFQVEFTNGNKAIFNEKQMLELKSGKSLKDIINSLDII